MHTIAHKPRNASSFSMSSRILPQNKLFVRVNIQIHLIINKDGTNLHRQGNAPWLHEMLHMRRNKLWANPCKPPKCDCTILDK